MRAGELLKANIDYRATANPRRLDLRNGVPMRDGRVLLEQMVRIPERKALGPVVERTDIRGLRFDREANEWREARYLQAPGYQIKYPQVVKQALVDIYAKYNAAFRPLVERNRENPTDYQHAASADGTPINGWVQIDMVGLPHAFLEIAERLPYEEVLKAVEWSTYEYENSLARYHLLMKIHEKGRGPSFFDQAFRASLDDIREKHKRPIALLAVTNGKYEAMKTTEFGKRPDESLTDEEVKQLSGFDKFFSPQEFLEHLQENGGDSKYLLYARTSLPDTALKKPGTSYEDPLMPDPEIRKVIKANAVTFNIDDPAWLGRDSQDPSKLLLTPRVINDTKEWMPSVGIGYGVYTNEDMLAPEVREYLKKGGDLKQYSGKAFFTPELTAFLHSQGVTDEQIAARQLGIHAKPMLASYGAIGHHHSTMDSAKLWGDIRRELVRRGPYVIQPQKEQQILTNSDTGTAYNVMDRNFIATPDGKNFRWMGGFRSLMPVDSVEAARGRNHGNDNTLWAEVR